MKRAFAIRLGLAAALLLAAGLSRADVYQLSAPDSQLRVLVYRAGPLAAAGHNHVVAATQMRGSIEFRPAAAGQSRFELTFPVSGLSVDDPGQRQAAGSAFAAPVDEADANGTRRNMLSPKVLDGEQYPQVQVRSQTVEGSLPDLLVRFALRIRNATRELTAPVHVKLDGGRLRATGSLRFTQSEFGIEPLKILLGAIAVQDEVTVDYDLVATRRSP